MNIEALAIAVTFSVTAFIAIMFIERWWIAFKAKRFADRITREIALDKAPPRLFPESLFVVEVSDSGVQCRRPDQTVESVTWDDLQCVEIVNTDEGPFVADVFWVLHGSNSGCAIPQGATGERELLDRLQRLPGFDNGALINAMGVTTNQRSVCWRRTSASA